MILNIIILRFNMDGVRRHIDPYTNSYTNRTQPDRNIKQIQFLTNLIDHYLGCFTAPDLNKIYFTKIQMVRENFTVYAQSSANERS